MCWGLFVIVVGLLRHVYGFQNTKQLGKTHIQLMSLLKHIMLGGFWSSGLGGRTVNKVITDLNITFIRSSVRVKNSKYS